MGASDKKRSRRAAGRSRVMFTTSRWRGRQNLTRDQTTTNRNTPHAKQHLTEGISMDPILFDLPPRHRTCRALRCRCSSRSSGRSTSAARISTSLWMRRRPKAIASNGTRGAALRNSWVTMAQPGETAVAIASIKKSMLPLSSAGSPQVSMNVRCPLTIKASNSASEAPYGIASTVLASSVPSLRRGRFPLGLQLARRVSCDPRVVTAGVGSTSAVAARHAAREVLTLAV
jgi:hypothetical protein